AIDGIQSAKIETTNWVEVQASLNERGYAVVKRFLDPDQCDEFRARYGERERYRKTVVMERYRFGLGEYKYFDYPLPAILQSLRENLYTKLVGVANGWMEALGIDHRFPGEHAELIEECRKKKQMQPTPLILRYGKGGFNTVHQDLDGAG